MLKLHAVKDPFEGLELVTVADCNSLETLNLNAQLIDDTPSDHLLPSDPDSGFFVIGLSKE